MDKQAPPASSPSQGSPEQPGLLRILASAFSGVLVGLLLSKLKAPIQASAETIHPQHCTNERRTEAEPPLPLTVRAESYSPPAISEEDKAKKQRARFYKRGSLVASVASVLITFGILVITWRYTIYAGEQLKTMKGQLQIMQTQMELQERPWIKIIDVKPRGDSPILGALSFQKIGPYKEMPDIRVQATLQIELAFSNIGHSVADVTPNIELFTPPFSTAEYWNRVSAEEQRFCGSPDMSAVTAQKVTVFPGESRPFTWNGGISTPIRAQNMNHLPEGSGIAPALIVCVSYRHKGLPSLYQTRAVYEISHEGTGIRFFDIGPCNLHPFNNAPFTFCEGGVPGKMLRFSRNYNGDEAY